MITPWIYLLFMIGISYSTGASSNQPILSNYYQKRISNNIVPPFLNAYTILNKKVIEKILSINPDSNKKPIKALLSSMQCNFQSITRELHRASVASEKIRSSLQKEEETLVLKLDKQEKIVVSKQKNVNESKINLEHAEKKLKEEEVAMADQKRLVEAAERDVKEADEAIERANNCERKRRKKRFLGVFCDMFKGKGVENAHERLILAVKSRHSIQHRFQLQQQNIKTQTFQLRTAESQLNAANTELNTVQSKLNQIQISLKNVASITTDFKKVETYLKEVSGSSKNIKDVLMTLTDFEHVIGPLNNIYQKMIDQKFINLHNKKKSAAITQPTKKDLEDVKEILTKLGLTITEEDVAEDENEDEDEDDFKIDLNMPCLSFDDFDF